MILHRRWSKEKRISHFCIKRIPIPILVSILFRNWTQVFKNGLFLPTQFNNTYTSQSGLICIFLLFLRMKANLWQATMITLRDVQSKWIDTTKSHRPYQIKDVEGKSSTTSILCGNVQGNRLQNVSRNFAQNTDCYLWMKRCGDVTRFDQCRCSTIKSTQRQITRLRMINRTQFVVFSLSVSEMPPESGLIA